MSQNPLDLFQGLHFDEKKHLYSYDGRILPSVTTVLKKYFEPFDRDKVAKKVSENPNSPYYGKSIKEIIEEWKKSGLSGTLTHEMIENYINNNDHSFSKDEVANKKAFHARKWLFEEVIKRDPLFIITEFRLFDLELNIAGTADLFVMWKDHSVSLGDWKTNKSIDMTSFGGKKAYKPFFELDDCNYTQYSLQLSAYALMLRRRGIHTKSLSIIHLREDGLDVIKGKNYESQLENELRNLLPNY